MRGRRLPLGGVTRRSAKAAAEGGGSSEKSATTNVTKRQATGPPASSRPTRSAAKASQSFSTESGTSTRASRSTRSLPSRAKSPSSRGSSVADVVAAADVSGSTPQESSSSLRDNDSGDNKIPPVKESVAATAAAAAAQAAKVHPPSTRRSLALHKRMSETSDMSSARTKCYEVLPSLDAVNEDGIHSTVKIVIGGQLYTPVRDTEDWNIVHDSSAIGQDGNQFYCQVCKGFGQIVCCDGCPKVYHPDCIPLEDPSRQSLDQDDDPWYCPECMNAKTRLRNDGSGKEEKKRSTRRNSATTAVGGRRKQGSGKAADASGSVASPSARRATSQKRCVDCQMNRTDLALEICEGCGNHVHHPSCLEDTKPSDSVFCSTCRAVDQQLTIESDIQFEKEQGGKVAAGTANHEKLVRGDNGEGDDEVDDGDDMEEEEEEVGDQIVDVTSPGGVPSEVSIAGEDPGGDTTPSSASKKRKRSNSTDRKHKKKKKDKKKQRKARHGRSHSPSPLPPPEEASPKQPPPLSEPTPYQYRNNTSGLAQATPAFFFYLSENRWKIERVLARNHRYFNRLPKGVERNELVAKEAALWWVKLRPADHRRYMNMSMRDYENRIIEWKEDKNLSAFGLVPDEASLSPSEEQVTYDDSVEDDRLTYERHDRLFLNNSVGSKSFKPEPNQSYNRVLLDLLHDMRFHPLPMFNANRSEDETVIDDHNAKVTIPHFEVHGPISTSVGDECLGCTRGWLHFCPVLQRRIPAIEHRARLQPPLSSWVATRVGVGLRPRLERVEEEKEDGIYSKPASLFKWRSSEEVAEISKLPVLPSNSLSQPTERADDVTGFIEETMAMKVPEPPRPPPPTASVPALATGRKLPTRVNESFDQEPPEGAVYKCGRCRTIIYNDTGCVQCRRAQLVINTTKKSPANTESQGKLKLRTVMLGRVQIKDGMSEAQSEGDIAVSQAILKHRWTPSAILPQLSSVAPGAKPPGTDATTEETETLDTDETEESVEGEDENQEITIELPGAPAAQDNDGRSRRSARAITGVTTLGTSESIDRDKILRENKKKSDELQRKALSIAICGILLALKRRDPLLLFAEPATAQGYSEVVKKPIDLGQIRSDVLAGKYSSMGAFSADIRLLCENALAFNPAGSIYSKTAKELHDLLSAMQKRASNWMGAIVDAYNSFLFNEESRKKKATADDQSESSVEPSDPFESLRKQWPQAVTMLENGEWLRKQIESDFMRTQENETAYYGSIAVRRVATAAESSLAPYTDSGGIHSVVSKRSDAEDEALRRLIDDRVSALTEPLQLKDISSWREESVVRLLRKVQTRRLDRRSATENGCSRCDSIDSVTESVRASNIEFAHPGRTKRKGEGDLPRVDPSRMYLTTGLGSAKTCQKITRCEQESKEDDVKALQDVCVSVRGSKIHGWGLFADQPFKKGEVVAEYLGEYVVNPIADTREKSYQEQRIQDYQFRLDDKLVIDATKKGGPGRYINHNCSPNCYAKILPGKDPKPQLKRVLIVAQRPIEINEEITYDYQFPLELNLANRIPCNCQSEDCRGFMNWDIPEKGSNNRALLVQKRGANMRDRIRRLGRPLKRDEV